MTDPGADSATGSPDRSLLEQLIEAADLPDVATEVRWRDFVEHVVETLDVGPGTRVWDVGCGAGAFLYPLWENGYVVGGVDPAPELIERARAAMPQGVFVVGAPTALDPADPWDVVVASRGFGGLADVDAARRVLARMAAKATHAIAVLSVAEEEVGRESVVGRNAMLRMLAEIGLTAVQFEEAAGGRFHVFARVKGTVPSYWSGGSTTPMPRDA
jgi:SAM-dependent methyltransferase